MVNTKAKSALKPFYAAGPVLLALIGLGFALSKPVPTQADAVGEARTEPKLSALSTLGYDFWYPHGEELPFSPVGSDTSTPRTTSAVLEHADTDGENTQSVEQVTASAASAVVNDAQVAPLQLLVLGSFQQFRYAEQAALSHSELRPGIMSATVNGQRYYRVVVRVSQEEAEERGIRNAWPLRVDERAQVLVVESWN